MTLQVGGFKSFLHTVAISFPQKLASSTLKNKLYIFLSTWISYSKSKISNAWHNYTFCPMPMLVYVNYSQFFPPHLSSGAASVFFKGVI